MKFQPKGFSCHLEKKLTFLALIEIRRIHELENAYDISIEKLFLKEFLNYLNGMEFPYSFCMCKSTENTNIINIKRSLPERTGFELAAIKTVEILEVDLPAWQS